MNKYRITIVRTSSAWCDIEMNANDIAEAIATALGQSEGYVYSKPSNEYLVEEVEAIQPDEDIGLSPEQLDDKYNQDGDGEHPAFVRATWRTHVAEQWTVSGYWDWVFHQVNEGELATDETRSYGPQGEAA